MLIFCAACYFAFFLYMSKIDICFQTALHRNKAPTIKGCARGSQYCDRSRDKQNRRFKSFCRWQYDRNMFLFFIHLFCLYLNWHRACFGELKVRWPWYSLQFLIFYDEKLSPHFFKVIVAFKKMPVSIINLYKIMYYLSRYS